MVFIILNVNKIRKENRMYLIMLLVELQLYTGGNVRKIVKYFCYDYVVWSTRQKGKNKHLQMFVGQRRLFFPLASHA